jgi:hypothetical protein
VVDTWFAGTLQTGYPRIQASSQDKEQGVHPRAAMYLVALDLTSLSRWAPVLQRVPRPRTSPSYRGGLRCCHVSRCLRSRLPAEVSSSATTCPSAPDLVSLLRWAPVLSHVPWFGALPP